MASGVSVKPECVTEFEAMKIRKTGRYIIFAMDKQLKMIGIESVGTRDSTYEEFQTAVLESSGFADGSDKKIECRYAVYDHEFMIGDSMRNKLVFVMWTPDNAPMKQKMVYASSKSALIKKLTGLGADVQATDLDEISEFSIDAKCRDKARS